MTVVYLKRSLIKKVKDKAKGNAATSPKMYIGKLLNNTNNYKNVEACDIKAINDLAHEKYDRFMLDNSFNIEEVIDPIAKSFMVVNSTIYNAAIAAHFRLLENNPEK